MVTDAPDERHEGMTYPKLPPVTELAIGTMVLVVAGGVFLAAYIPQRPPLAPAYGLLVASAALLLVNVVQLSRLRRFAWGTFFLVARWALLAYLVIAGMLEYVFVVDGTPGNIVVVLTLMLVIFAVDIPLILAFSVARYQPAKETLSSPH